MVIVIRKGLRLAGKRKFVGGERSLAGGSGKGIRKRKGWHRASCEKAV